jgi:hypothetical protein
MVRNVRIHLEGIEPDIATLRSDMPAAIPKPFKGTKRIQEVFAVRYGKVW